MDGSNGDGGREDAFAGGTEGNSIGSEYDGLFRAARASVEAVDYACAASNSDVQQLSRRMCRYFDMKKHMYAMRGKIRLLLDDKGAHTCSSDGYKSSSSANKLLFSMLNRTNIE